MRRTLIVANWKMNKKREETTAFLKAVSAELSKKTNLAEVLICPPFTSIETAAFFLDKFTFKLGGQNLFWEAKGSFTGEISAAMLKDLSCEYVIIGHSERRSIFAENDRIVNKKVLAALQNALIPVLCVGESLQQRESHQARDVVKKQLERALLNVSYEDIDKCALVIAYEPVWAIGTGINANGDDAEEMILFIRELLISLYNKPLAEQTRILYGGSVNPQNISSFLEKPNIDGALVGGASLEVDSFLKIVRAAAHE